MMSFLLGFVTCYSVVITLAYRQMVRKEIQRLGGFVPEQSRFWNRW